MKANIERLELTMEEQLKLEHSTLMEQYKAIRYEINSILSVSRQTVNLTLTVIALFLGVSLFVEAKLPMVFLIAPFFLYGLTLTQLRHILIMRECSEYITVRIAPRVRAILMRLSPEGSSEFDYILDWEQTWRTPARDKGGTWLLPALGAGYALPLFAAVLSLIVYVSTVSQVSTIGWLLIAANLLALLYCLGLGFWLEFNLASSNI
jgi:hypothetical protein